MFKAKKVKIFLAASLIVVFTLIISSSSMIAGPIDSFSEIQQKLQGVSEEKKKILENLFVLIQDIEETEREEKESTREIEVVNREIENLKVMISDEEKAYANKRDIVKRILKSYQKMGPGSYLEVILDSDNLTMLLQRINILRDFTHSSGELLESLQESGKKLSAEKATLDEKLVLMEDKRKKLKESLTKKLQLKEDKDKYLASLEQESKYYEQHLADIQQVWDELKLSFSGITREFSRIIQEGDLPWDDLKITYTLYSIKGTIDEKAFNEIIKGYSDLPEMVIKFHPGKIEIAMPKKNLILKGTFVIQDEQILKFKAEEGSFYGMALETSAIEELFREGYLGLNLEPLLGRSILNSVEITEGNLELNIKPVFF